MEYYWTLFNNSNGSTSNTVRGQNGYCTPNHAWESWDNIGSSSSGGGGGGGSSRPADWSYYPLHHSLNYTPPPATAAAADGGGAFHGLMLHDQEKRNSCASTTTTATCSSFNYIGKDPNCYNIDPHFTCLKLGKRHYFEDFTPPVVGERQLAAKKGKSYIDATYGGRSAPPVEAAEATVVPRCQVEGCEAVLVNAKDYHRRHKVCEMHAKAPKVVVHGTEQRFCQQCSRFHAVAEFDDAKRSCRRRLAGHNERRRKSSQEHNSLARKHSQDIKMMAASRHPHFMNNSECALSLLSSSHYTPWNISTSPDLPARCSAALRELIAENRASILACRQLINANQIEDYNSFKLGSIRAGSSPQENGGHVTLNLMQGPNSVFGLLPMHNDHKSTKEENGDECSELWKVPLGY